MKRLLVPFVAGALPAFILMFSIQTGRAGSATWKQNPVSGDWNTAANWSPSTVPNGPSDIATFASSNITNVSLSANTEVNTILFNPGASFTIRITPTDQSTQFTVSGAGITNKGGIQHFVVAGPNVVRGPSANITFLNTASAGQDDIYFTLDGGPRNTSTGGQIIFSDHSNAGNASFTLNAGSVRGGSGGLLIFASHASAGNATLMALGGNGALGGQIVFGGRCDGGTARIQLFGNRTDLPSNGSLDISAHTMSGGGPGPVTIGSLQGDGAVFLGPATLIVGSNNIKNTRFLGVISWMGSHGGIGGGLVKIGTGRLNLTNGNTYLGGTTIKRGALVVNNRTGSGTGDGPVQVERGTLGGKGTITGTVTLGTGNGSGAVLAPGHLHGAGRLGALTIHNGLTFNSDGVYQAQVNSSTIMTDQVTAVGVSISPGAQLDFVDIGNGTLPIGTVFPVIDNTAATSIAGTFSNLPEGSVFIANGNTYQVSYQGGDGNDLTLTVVP